MGCGGSGAGRFEAEARCRPDWCARPPRRAGRRDSPARLAGPGVQETRRRRGLSAWAASSSGRRRTLTLMLRLGASRSESHIGLSTQPGPLGHVTRTVSRAHRRPVRGIILSLTERQLSAVAGPASRTRRRRDLWVRPTRRYLYTVTVTVQKRRITMSVSVPVALNLVSSARQVTCQAPDRDHDARRLSNALPAPPGSRIPHRFPSPFRDGVYQS